MGAVYSNSTRIASADTVLTGRACRGKERGMTTVPSRGSAPSGSTSTSGFVTRGGHLEELVGAHPTALRAIFEGGRAPSPDELIGSWQGRFVALPAAREIAALLRPVFRTLRGGAPLWTGKTFFPDATGVNHLLGQRAVRLGVEPGFSELDGAPAVIFRYDLPQHKNPWPICNVRDELRLIGGDLALGHGMISATAGGARRMFAWFALQRA